MLDEDVNFTQQQKCAFHGEINGKEIHCSTLCRVFCYRDTKIMRRWSEIVIYNET